MTKPSIQHPKGAIKSRMNMWSWDFERYSKILLELDNIRLNVFNNDNPYWYNEMERYKSCLKTLVTNWISFINGDELKLINKEFNGYEKNYRKGMNVLYNSNIISKYLNDSRNNLEQVDLMLMKIKQFKGLGLDIKNDLSDKTKLRRHILGNE